MLICVNTQQVLICVNTQQVLICVNTQQVLIYTAYVDVCRYRACVDRRQYIDVLICVYGNSTHVRKVFECRGDPPPISSHLSSTAPL